MRGVTFLIAVAVLLLSSSPFSASLALGVSTAASKNIGTARFAASSNKLLAHHQQRRGGAATSPHTHGTPTTNSALRQAGNDQDAKTSPSFLSSKLKSIRQFANKNSFLVGMFVAVGLARLFPKLGTNGGVLRPEMFIGRYGVTLIFLLSGLSLELHQLKDAAANWKLNSMIQLGTFAAWPLLIGLPLYSLLSTTLGSALFPEALLDGLLIMTCLPTTVNMCVILSSAAGGNTASALCNAIISNLAGIFLTPALLYRFFGTTIQLPFMQMFLKLCSKVLLPVTVGQMLRATRVKSFYDTHAKRFKRLQEFILLSILWNAFCTAITNNLGLSLQHGLALLILLPAVHLVALGALFKFFSIPSLNFSRKDVVSAMFCSSQKTLAFGLPLINTIFEGNPNVATYCAPLMLVHPLQLMVGSALVPRLERYTTSEAAAPYPTDQNKKEASKDNAAPPTPAAKPARSPPLAEASEVMTCKQVWIGQIIGPKGATLKEIQASTGAQVEIGDSSQDPISITVSGNPKATKSAMARIDAIIKDAENPDYEGSEGKKWRQEADRCAEKAEECAKEKDALFDQGDKAGGHAKLEEVKEWQLKMHEANDKAAKSIFQHRNKGKGDRYMDFHGLRKQEALDILEVKMANLKNKKGDVELIPGAGHHSAGSAVLKPAVINYLKKNGFEYEEQNAGVLIVHL